MLAETGSEYLQTLVQTRLTEFVRLARDNEFRVGVAEEIDAQRVAAHCGLFDVTQLRWGLRALLCTDAEEWQRFDELFDAYWRSANLSSRVQARPGSAIERRTSVKQAGNRSCVAPGGLEAAGEQGEDIAAEGEGASDGATASESLSRTDFGLLSDGHQQRAVERMVERLARKMRRRLQRRQRLHRQGRLVHLRGTFRRCLRFGGLPLQLVYRQRRRRQPRLILIIDVSRSMALYSNMFLRFARGIVNAFSDSAAFAYHTRLVPITEALRQADAAKMQASLALLSQGWGGGTRIGECLAQFNECHGALLNSRSVVVVVSDGLDTGEPVELADALSTIKRRTKKLVWLSPLLGRAGYEPRTQSLLAALPLLDVFAPAHNVESLEALEPTLCAI
jgi:uncharacterized protein with von Willebrand factor type A (vWA) domain